MKHNKNNCIFMVTPKEINLVNMALIYESITGGLNLI